MTKKQRYYEYLYKRLVLVHREWNGEGKLIHKEVELSQELKELLDQISGRLGIRLHKNAVLNVEKFQLWREEFGATVDSKYVEAATYFVLYCCLADKILDTERFTQQEKERVYLDIKNFWNSSYNKSGEFLELYKMRRKVLGFFAEMEKLYNNRYRILKDKIDCALASECFIYDHSLTDFDKDMNVHNVLDKSVEFVSASFLIGIGDLFEKEDIDVTDLIGEIFGYIDDICDYVLDLETGSLNMALLICMNEKKNISLEERIGETVIHMDIMISLLEDKVIQLQKKVSTQMYLYLLDELWCWTGDIRRYVTEYPESNDISDSLGI